MSVTSQAWLLNGVHLCKAASWELGALWPWEAGLADVTVGLSSGYDEL